MRRYLPFVIVGAVLLITAGGALLLYRSKLGPPLKIATGTPGAEPAHIRGAANARVTLEEFGDFQCPPCGFLAAILLKVEHDYADSVRVVFRQFPLGMHQHAMTAACAAEAAGMQGRFWEMHDMLFQNSVLWGKPPAPRPSAAPAEGANLPPPDTVTEVRATFEGYAAKLGLDVERFRRDMNSEEVKARIKLDQDRAASIGVDRTPFLFIDGVQIPFTSLGEKELRGVIDAGLSGRTPAPPPPSPTPAPPQNPTSAALPLNPAPPTPANSIPSPKAN
jgi:protein-disulfide isomerase